MKKTIIFSISILASLFLVSCETVRVGGGTSSPPPGPSEGPPVVKKGGPPDHAPAHGFRRKFQYYYYPSSKVYYSVERKVYFWIEGDGWKFGATLPAGFTISGDSKVSVSIDDETPYAHYDANYKSTHPGKGKAKGKDKKKYK